MVTDITNEQDHTLQKLSGDWPCGLEVRQGFTPTALTNGQRSVIATPVIEEPVGVFTPVHEALYFVVLEDGTEGCIVCKREPLLKPHRTCEHCHGNAVDFD